VTEEFDDSPADTMEERGGNPLKLAVVLRTNRLVFAGSMALGVFVTFVVAVAVLDPSFVQQLRSGDMIDTLFSTMIGAVLTGTTLVVTIGQLVLTQENGPLGDQRDRMSNSMDFREFTEELIGRPSPTDPGEFLRELVEATVSRSTALRDGVDRRSGGRLQEEVDAFVGSVNGNARSVSDQLDGAQFGSFDVVSAALNFNYSWKIAKIEQLQSEYATELDDRDVERLDDLKTVLAMFGSAREHVKTLYFQWELIALSQLILYAAVPAVVMASVMVAVVSPETVSGTLFGIERILLLVGAAFAVTLLPFLLFVAYILRILTVAKHTLAIEPLILRD